MRTFVIFEGVYMHNWICLMINELYGWSLTILVPLQHIAACTFGLCFGLLYCIALHCTALYCIVLYMYYVRCVYMLMRTINNRHLKVLKLQQKISIMHLMLYSWRKTMLMHKNGKKMFKLLPKVLYFQDC